MPEAVQLLDVQDVDGGEGVLHRRAIFGPHPTDWDPFILWGYDRFERGAFSWHPHKGFETVTLVLSGNLEHKDSMGGHGILGPGDVQWMTAGSGVLHSEEPAGDEAEVLQLWLNLPSACKDAGPCVQDIPESQAALHVEGALVGRVYGGRFWGVQGPALLQHDAVFATMELGGGRAHLPLDAGCVACLHVLGGILEVDGVEVPAGGAVRLNGPCAVEAKESARAALIASTPIGEPVVLHFPFVLGDETEVGPAFAAVEAGDFGRPW